MHLGDFSTKEEAAIVFVHACIWSNLQRFVMIADSHACELHKYACCALRSF